MPTTHAASKALRQNIKIRARNRVIKDQLKKMAVNLRKAYTAKDAAKAKEITIAMIRAYDKAAQKKIIHRNAAGRKKARLLARLRKG